MEAVEALVLRMVEENPTWGYDRVVGALSNRGHEISDQTVGNILKRNGFPPAPKREPVIPWSEFIERHQDVITACDFFTAEVFTPQGSISYYVLFFIKIGSREVDLGSSCSEKRDFGGPCGSSSPTTTRSEIIRARTMFCSSRPRTYRRRPRATRSSASSVSAGC
jgi:hypothetical protein